MKSDPDGLDDNGPTIANIPSSSMSNGMPQVTHHATTVDGVNLDEIREFAKAFKLRRLALGLTQTQVGQALSATKGPAYSQSAICRFEKLDITPKSAAKIKPVLEKWMQEAELKYADRLGLIHFYIFCVRLTLGRQSLVMANETFLWLCVLIGSRPATSRISPTCSAPIAPRSGRGARHSPRRRSRYLMRRSKRTLIHQVQTLVKTHFCIFVVVKKGGTGWARAYSASSAHPFPLSIEYI